MAKLLKLVSALILTLIVAAMPEIACAQAETLTVSVWGGGYGEDWKKKVLDTRQDERWELLGVSDYALEWTGRKGTVIPNGINERFFINHNLERDIDILVEGNDEPIKNIRYTIAKAKAISDNVALLTRTDNHQYDVKVFENPPQEEIPKIYQRAKKFFKFSHSEGFCLPIVEAFASGCIVHTHHMGGNDFCVDGENCWIDNYDESKNDYIISNAMNIAKKFRWELCENELIKYLCQDHIKNT